MQLVCQVSVSAVEISFNFCFSPGQFNLGYSGSTVFNLFVEIYLTSALNPSPRKQQAASVQGYFDLGLGIKPPIFWSLEQLAYRLSQTTPLIYDSNYLSESEYFINPWREIKLS